MNRKLFTASLMLILLSIALLAVSCTTKKPQVNKDVWDIQFSESGTTVCDVTFEYVCQQVHKPQEDMVIYRNHRVYKIVVE